MMHVFHISSVIIFEYYAVVSFICMYVSGLISVAIPCIHIHLLQIPVFDDIFSLMVLYPRVSYNT